VVATRTKELAKLTESAAALRASSEEGAREWETRVSALRAEKDDIFTRHSELKRDMDRSRGADAALLRDQVVSAAARAKALTEVLAKAQRVIRMAELNASVDAQQRAALAAAGVLEQPGVALSVAAARERSRLRASEAAASGAATAHAHATGAVEPSTNFGLSVSGTGLGLGVSGTPALGSTMGSTQRVKSPVRPGTSALGATARPAAAAARPAVTRPASTR
jgi:hypothetical protein